MDLVSFKIFLSQVRKKKKNTWKNVVYGCLRLTLLQIPNTTVTLGVKVLENFDVFPNKNWYWIGIAAILGFAILFNILFTIALTYLNRKNPLSSPPVWHIICVRNSSN